MAPQAQARHQKRVSPAACGAMEKTMNRYRLSITIEDEVVAPTHYEAFLKFRERSQTGYYGPRHEDVEFIEEVEETPTEPESP